MTKDFFESRDKLLKDLEQTYIDCKEDGWTNDDTEPSVGLSPFSVYMLKDFIKNHLVFTVNENTNVSIVPYYDGKIAVEIQTADKQIITMRF
jgi:hypothetical protein